MEDDKIRDMTLSVLVNIRDEIKALREDTNTRFDRMDKRFEQMDRRFERMEEDLSQMRRDIGHIVARFDNDYLVLASEVDSMKKRLGTCESRLGISATQ